jgi:predicted DNA-binding protein (MmcQ/YjbR family)
VEEVLEHALSKPGAWLDHPWDENHDVVKVGERMFVTAGADQDEPSFSIKHEDMEAREAWRARLPTALENAPYLPNKPWSRVFVDRDVDADDVRELVDESYVAVVRRLARKHRPDGWDSGLTD